MPSSEYAPDEIVYIVFVPLMKKKTIMGGKRKIDSLPDENNPGQGSDIYLYVTFYTINALNLSFHLYIYV